MLVGRLILFISLCVALPIGAATDYHFKVPGRNAPVALAPTLLSETDRQFIQRLPEIRVAMQQVGAPPYELVGADGEVEGYQADVLSYLATALGLRIRPVVFPDWPSVLRAVREGEADMVLTLAITPERLRYLEFTLGTVPVPAGLLARRGTLVPVDGARIALEREYYGNDLVRRQYPRAIIVPTNTTIEALRAVAEGRADYYVGSLLEAIDAMSHNPVAGIEVREILQSGSGLYHFGIRKDWAPLAGILNKGIARIRADGEPRAVAAAASSLPGGAAPLAAMTMTAADLALLARRSVWRLGAVRGLAMLNDVDARGAHSGISAEYTEHVARRLGVGIELVGFDNVAAMLDGLRDGRIDFVPFLTRTREREREFSFSKPYFEMPYMLVARSDAPLYWDLGSLRGKRLALALQHPLREVLAQRFADIGVLDARDGNEAMEMVARGDADAAVEVKVFANLHINNDPAARLRAVGQVNELPAQFSFASTRESAALLPLIDRALDEVPPVERERMLRRWVAIDLDPPFPWRRHLPTLLVGAAALLLLATGTAWWMRRLAREVRARRHADEQLDDIGRTMPGVAFRYTLGRGGRLTRSFFSSGAEAFLGVRPTGHQTLLDVLAGRLRPEQAEQALEVQSASLRSGEPFKVTCAYTRPDGREMWLHAEAVCSHNRDGDAVWTGYVVDVSTERQLQERLAREADERHVLLASASHELRAPTHTLSLALQAIPADGVAPASARSLRIAREASRTLAQLLDDVLDAARFQAGPMELRPQDFELRAFVEQLREAHAGALAAKQLGFECQIGPEVPRMVFLDPLRLKQVLSNLLGNAVRYTHQGHVALRVGARARIGQAPMLEFVVEDSGEGIPAERQQHLFEPFGSVSAAPGSTGLGLSICRRLAQMMDGTIEVDSAPGHGTTVRVALPAGVRGPAGTPLRHGGAVLLCDDDPVCRMLMAEALSTDGHRVVEVADGQAALERWRRGDVSLVITDLTMPRMSGVELIDAIRADETGRAERTAIIVCSGDPAPTLDTAAAAGAPRHDAFLSKPMDLRTLAEALASLGVRRMPTAS